LSGDVEINVVANNSAAVATHGLPVNMFMLFWVVMP
jgi:hypothetical protein